MCPIKLLFVSVKPSDDSTARGKRIIAMNQAKICSVSTTFGLAVFLLLVSAFSSSANAAQLSLNSATQSSTGFSGVAERAIDGNTSGIWSHGSITHTGLTSQPWWSAELSSQANIEEVVLWNRTNCCSNRLSDFYLLISEAPFATNSLSELLSDSNVWSSFHAGAVGESVSIPVEATGQYVRVQLTGQNFLSLAEVQVYGVSYADRFNGAREFFGRAAGRQ